MKLYIIHTGVGCQSFEVWYPSVSHGFVAGLGNQELEGEKSAVSMSWSSHDGDLISCGREFLIFVLVRSA